ncbi:MAG: DNA mismatch repair endonuclease MutL [Chloroflexi bacterium]|nr:DNA mismatch repair endonuclease MutL [Chloroflexota bacterium]
MPIKVLDKETVSRIAAGEVVERPASVVKELVENSLDGGSSQISVEVRGSGVSLIRVVDNGIGIPSTEVELAFDRYATSKIGSIDDLESIPSLGFRGEALPSIATVAEVEIVTRAADESVGTHLSFEGGAVDNRGCQGRSKGTTITVRNLLRKVPARLKFLKSPATENSHVANVVTQYALAFPEVKFTLVIDGRQTLRTPGNGRLIDSMIEVYGVDVVKNMLEIKDEGWESGVVSSPLQVTGMISSPAVSRSGRDYLSFFVNRRWINSRLLAWAVEEAYHGLLMQGRHPIAIINISLPAREVDVNIHPTKTEVKFHYERAVFSTVQKAVRRTLIKQMPVPKIEEVATKYVSPSTPRQALWTSTEVSATYPAVSPETPAVTLPILRVLGQLSNSYIIAEGPDGLYLIDQHAAHERILFERIKDQRSRQEIEVQGLLEPVTLEVNPKEEEALNLHYEDLAEFGFSIEPFGDRTYLVRAVPLLLHNKDWAGTVRELLASLSGGNKSDWWETIAISIACHSAVRAGQALTDDEMRELIRQMEQTPIPNTCPHGRPTMLRISSGQLTKEFGRSS